MTIFITTMNREGVLPSPHHETRPASGAESLRAIAAGLNARGIPTARGAGQWSAVQVARVIERHS
jgi:hypothetical protein